MHIQPLEALPEVKRIYPAVHRDARGEFLETWRESWRSQLPGCLPWVQQNLSRSAVGVLRGLHYQLPPHAQGKLVRVLHGRIFDVVVDIRRTSPSFGQHACCELDHREPAQLWIPPGFAHGFLALEPDTVIQYEVTAEYAPQAERCIAWNDPQLAVPWPPGYDILVSARDARGDRWRDAEPFPV